jgi:hypothetical protein
VDRVKGLVDRLGAGAVGADPVDVGALGLEQLRHFVQAPRDLLVIEWQALTDALWLLCNMS